MSALKYNKHVPTKFEMWFVFFIKVQPPYTSILLSLGLVRSSVGRFLNLKRFGSNYKVKF
jgi:hypothetical protein